MIKVFSVIISSIWIACYYTMGPSPMEPKEFSLYYDKFTGSYTLEIPETSGFSVHEATFFPVGYEISPILNYLEDNYNLCMNFHNITEARAFKLRDRNPDKIPISLNVVKQHIMLGEKHNLVTINPLQPGYNDANIIGYTGANITLNTIKC